MQLGAAGATLDLTSAGNQTIQDLSGTAGTVKLGAHLLTVGTGRSTTFGGSVTGTGAGLAKVGTGALTLTGKSATPGGSWQVRQGTLQLGDPSHSDASVQAALAVAAGATFAGTGQVTGTVTNAGTVATATGGTLAITGGYTQAAGATLLVPPTWSGSSRMSVTGAVALAGGLRIAPGTAPGDVGQLTLIDNTGSGPVSGTFDGLPEGATTTVAGTTYRISYTGGDGNDVVLTIAQRAGGAAGGVAGALTGHGGSTPVILAGAGIIALLICAAGLLLVLRRRSRRRLAGAHRGSGDLVP